jgi:hypothetical protein
MIPGKTIRIMVVIFNLIVKFFDWLFSFFSHGRKISVDFTKFLVIDSITHKFYRNRDFMKFALILIIHTS